MVEESVSGSLKSTHWLKVLTIVRFSPAPVHASEPLGRSQLMSRVTSSNPIEAGGALLHKGHRSLALRHSMQATTL